MAGQGHKTKDLRNSDAGEKRRGIRSGRKSRFQLGNQKSKLKIFEFLYNDIRNVTEVQNKWIYVFNQTSSGGSLTLIEEIFAKPGGWVNMKEPGKAKDFSTKSNYETYSYTGYFDVFKRYKGVGIPKGIYSFFLSPLQLGQNSIDELKKQASNSSAPRKPSRGIIKIKGFPFLDYGDFVDIKQVITRFSFEDLPAPSIGQQNEIYAVLIPDPFAWVEDLHYLKYQGAMEMYFNLISDEKRQKELLIAQAFKGVMARDKQTGNEDVMGIGNEFAHPSKWMSKTRRYNLPKFESTRRHHDGTRVKSHYVSPNKRDWNSLSTKFRKQKNLPQLRIEMDRLEKEAILNKLYKYAVEIAEYVESPRHKIIEQAALENGSDYLAHTIVHWSKISFGLGMGTVLPGQRLLVNIYKDGNSFVRKVLEDAKPNTASKWWDSTGPVQKITLSAFKLVDNFMGAISVVEGKNFQKVGKDILKNKLFRVKWVKIEPTKILGKSVSQSLPDLQIDVKKTSILADSQSFYKKYKIDKWFDAADLGLKGINLLFSFNKLLSGKITAEDRAKTVLDTADFAFSTAQFKLKLQPGGAETKMYLGLQRASYFVSAVSGFIDFSIATDAMAKSIFMDRNYKVTVAQGIAATGAAISAGAGVWGLIFGGLVSGPLGWIALVAGGLSIIGAYLASVFKRNQWEEVAKYSYLGKEFLNGSGKDFHKNYFQGNGYDFGRKLSKQVNAITGLMAGFKIKLKYTPSNINWPYKMTIIPNTITKQSYFTVFWQYKFLFTTNYSNLRAYWVYLEAKINISEDKIKITKREIKIDGFPTVPKIFDSLLKDSPKIQFKNNKQGYIRNIEVSIPPGDFRDNYDSGNTFRKYKQPSEITIGITLYYRPSNDITITLPFENTIQFKKFGKQDSTIPQCAGFTETLPITEDIDIKAI